METKICIKCEIEKPVSEYEFRKDTNKYRNVCKYCQKLQKKKRNVEKDRDVINEKRRIYYQQNKDIINEKRRIYYQQNKDIINEKRKIRHQISVEEKIKQQLKNTLDKSFTRKELKRKKSYEDLLCCDVNYAVDYLIKGYEKKYKKKLIITDEVDIDHILSLWSAYKQESVEDLCCYKNLRLLSKRDNHNRKYKITNDEMKLIKEYLDFLHKYKSDEH